MRDPLADGADPQRTAAPAEIVVENVHKAFGEVRVLRGVNLTIRRGEMIAIVGGSGSGKTVLLKLITGHLWPDEGRILVADHESPPEANAPLRDIASLNDDDMDRLRVHWAVVFQRNALLSGSVYDNLALWPTEIKRMSEDQILPLARRALTDVGLNPDDVMNRPREVLSGGMAKRLAIARALVMDPVLIFYDEPTAGLDPEMCMHIHDLIAKTHAAAPSVQGATIRRTSVIVTHDTELLRRLQPRIVMVYDGTVLFDGSFDEFVTSDNEHIRPYVQQMPTLQAVRRGGE